MATALGVLTTAALGQWQLSRAAQKEAIDAQWVAQAALPILFGADVLEAKGQAHQLTGRLVQLTGHWLAEHTVYLDNRQMQGRAGFYVLTPLQLSGTNDVVVVQRGWVPRNFEQRKQLPEISTPVGELTLKGRLAGPPSRLYDLGGTESGAIRQNLDLESFSLELKTQSVQTFRLITEVSVQQSSETVADGLLRNWPVIKSGVDKHYGYAFQWFALSLLMVGLFLWFQFFKSRQHHE